jgi:DNA-nicking Smr family endonuclease
MARGKTKFFDSDSRSKPAPKNADVKRSREVPEGDSRFKPAQKSADLKRPRDLPEGEAHFKPVQKRSRAKPLSAADLQLWAAYSQTLSRLMPGKTRLPVAAETPPPAAPPAPEHVPPKPRAFAVAAPVSLDLTPAGLDKSTWKRFRSGKIRAGQRLDLHGHTAVRAHHAVIHFIERSYSEQLRCIEIITGKGEILARELPHWLNAPSLRHLILAIAHPHAANTGSVRILLRRIR